MTNTEILGFVAAFLTTSSFLPQAIQVLKTRDTASLSLAMYSIFTLGVALWMFYGIYQMDYAMIAANMVTFILSASILGTKVYTEYIAQPANQDVCENPHISNF